MRALQIREKNKFFFLTKGALNTSRKVAVSIPDGIGIFHLSNPSDRTMDLESNQPLTKGTINNSWG